MHGRSSLKTEQVLDPRLKHLRARGKVYWALRVLS